MQEKEHPASRRKLLRTNYNSLTFKDGLRIIQVQDIQNGGSTKTKVEIVIGNLQSEHRLTVSNNVSREVAAPHFCVRLQQDKLAQSKMFHPSRNVKKLMKRL